MGTPAGGSIDNRADTTAGGASLLRRDRLLDRLRSSRPRVILVTGPAGAGKSTLLGQIRSESDQPSVLATVTQQHSSRRCLLDQIQLSVPDSVPTAGGPWQSVDDLVATLTGGELRYSLYLDDIHLIEDSEAGRVLDVLLTDGPPDLRLVLTSRRIPRPALSQLRLSGELLHLDADDLRFRSWEVEDLFRIGFERPLPPEEAAALTRRTEGWAAALQLFHLASEGQADGRRRQLIDEMASHSRHLAEYLADQVLDALPERLREFLASTFPLDVLTAPLCEAMCGRSDAASTLRELVRRQIFTTEVRDEAGCYRYHDVLRGELEALAIEAHGRVWVLERHAKAAAALERAGRLVYAACSYARAGRWGDVARLAGAERNGADVTARIELIPEGAARDDGHLLIALARREVRNGSVRRALRLYDRAAGELAGVSTAGAAACRHERIAVAAWISDHDITPAGWLSWLRRLTRTPVDVPPTESSLVRAMAATVGGDAATGAALAHPVACDTSAPPLRQLVAGLLSVGVSAFSITRPAGLDAAFALRQLGQEAWELGYPSLARIVWSALALTEQPDGLDMAVSSLEGSLRAGDAWGEAIASLNLGVGRILRSNEDLASESLDHAAQLFDQLGAPVLRDRTRSVMTMAGGETDSGDTLVVVHQGSDRVGIRCFGAFDCRRGTGPVDLESVRPQARMLLRFLAMHGETGVHREVIAASLWPDLDPEQVRSRVQVAVSGLRAALAVEPAIERVDESYRLASRTITSDVADFDAAAAVARHARRVEDREALERALSTMIELHRGPLLAEDGPADWLVDHRERLQCAAADAAAELAALALGAGDLDRAGVAADHGLGIDRHRDDLWRLLIRVHKAAGNLAAEVEARTRYQDVLTVLGVDGDLVALTP